MQILFNIVVVVFTVANLAAMGLELNLREALRTLRSARAIGLILLWGWVAGPALAWSITRLVPLTEAHAAGLLLISLAPTAPFFPLMVRKARGDMSFAGAFMLVTTLGTVLLLPLMAPLSDLIGVSRQTAVFAFTCGAPRCVAFARLPVPPVPGPPCGASAPGPQHAQPSRGAHPMDRAAKQKKSEEALEFVNSQKAA